MPAETPARAGTETRPYNSEGKMKDAGEGGGAAGQFAHLPAVA